MFYAKCGMCDLPMEYQYRKTAVAAEKAGRVCKDCRVKRKELRKAKNSNYCTKEKKYFRYCPMCSEKVYSDFKSDIIKADKSKRPCRACASVKRREEYHSGITRECPNCKKILTYSCVDSCTRANKENVMCKSCSLKTKGIGPTKECKSAALAALTGRTQTKEHKQRRKNTMLKRYGSEHYLGSEEHKRRMAEKGVIQIIHGKAPHAWATEHNVPLVAIYRWLKSNPEPLEQEIRGFCENYIRPSSDLENIISDRFNIEKWDKRYLLNYRPDFKFNDKILLNADGLYWHSENVCDDKMYHFNMRKGYEKEGIRLFQFRDDEIINNLNIVESIVNNALGKTENKIGARKTIIGDVKGDEARLFLDQNHLKGFIKAKHVGLYFNDELVSLMSFKVFKKGILKIERFCSKINYNIMGAFNKLLKHIESNYSGLQVHYWVDLRYGTGTFLLNHNFVLEKETLGWNWTEGKNTYNRLKCRANMDERGLSEKEHAKELGWYKIYDAGQRLYVKN